MNTTCVCGCGTCRDTFCTGRICQPHTPGRWIIETPLMEHPAPFDFSTQYEAEAWLNALPDVTATHLYVSEVTG